MKTGAYALLRQFAHRHLHIRAYENAPAPAYTTQPCHQKIIKNCMDDPPKYVYAAPALNLAAPVLTQEDIAGAPATRWQVARRRVAWLMRFVFALFMRAARILGASPDTLLFLTGLFAMIYVVRVKPALVAPLPADPITGIMPASDFACESLDLSPRAFLRATVLPGTLCQALPFPPHANPSSCAARVETAAAAPWPITWDLVDAEERARTAPAGGERAAAEARLLRLRMDRDEAKWRAGLRVDGATVVHCDLPN
jgi:hypothetical protein